MKPPMPPTKSLAARSRKKTDWKALIGCPAKFTAKGILNVYRNAKVVRMDDNGGGDWAMLVKFDEKNVYFTTKYGFITGEIPKKFVKVC